MTASGVWTYRLAGLPTGEPRVQSALQWLSNNYRYDSMVQINGWPSQYYYLWAASKALEVTADDNSGQFLFSDSHRRAARPGGGQLPRREPSLVLRLRLVAHEHPGRRRSLGRRQRLPQRLEPLRGHRLRHPGARALARRRLHRRRRRRRPLQHRGQLPRHPQPGPGRPRRRRRGRRLRQLPRTCPTAIRWTPTPMASGTRATRSELRARRLARPV
jgi:hypothetical protein